MSTLHEEQLKWRSRGAKGLLGSLITANITGVENVRLQDLRDAILNNPALPDDWAPEVPNTLTMYLSTMVDLGRSSELKRKFLPNAWGEYEINPETHRQYVVTRMELSKDSEVPTRHKVMHLVKAIDNGTIQDIEADEGIQIWCRRIVGTVADDATGNSEFAIELYDSNQRRISASERPEYLPFIRTLEAEFSKKTNQWYGGSEVRTLIHRILHDKLHVVPVNRSGLYFTESDNFDKVEALRTALSRVHSGISLYNLAVPAYGEPYGMGGQSDMIVDASTTHMQEQMSALIDDLRNMSADSGTRPSTWNNRAESFKELTERMQKLHRIQAINTDTLRQQYKIAANLLKEGINGIK